VKAPPFALFAESSREPCSPKPRRDNPSSGTSWEVQLENGWVPFTIEAKFIDKAGTKQVVFDGKRCYTYRLEFDVNGITGKQTNLSTGKVRMLRRIQLGGQASASYALAPHNFREAAQSPSPRTAKELVSKTISAGSVSSNIPSGYCKGKPVDLSQETTEEGSGLSSCRTELEESMDLEARRQYVNEILELHGPETVSLVSRQPQTPEESAEALRRLRVLRKGLEEALKAASPFDDDYL
jgi:hypothetical protein